MKFFFYRLYILVSIDALCYPGQNMLSDAPNCPEYLKVNKPAICRKVFQSLQFCVHSYKKSLHVIKCKKLRNYVFDKQTRTRNKLSLQKCLDIEKKKKLLYFYCYLTVFSIKRAFVMNQDHNYFTSLPQLQLPCEPPVGSWKIFFF